jgi:hypothetical protein
MVYTKVCQVVKRQLRRNPWLTAARCIANLWGMAINIKDKRAPGGKVPVTNIRMDLWMTEWVNKAKGQLGRPKQWIYEEAIAEYLTRRGVVPPREEELESRSHGRVSRADRMRGLIEHSLEELTARKGKKR